MALTLSAPLYSFVQVANYPSPTACAPGQDLCLPVKTPADLSFQLIARVSGDDKDWFEVEVVGEGEDPITTKESIWGRICTECANLTGEEPDLPNSFSYSAEWRKTGTDGSTDIWVGNFTFNGSEATFSALSTGQCFNICFYRVEYDVEDITTLLGVNVNLKDCTITCFNKIIDDCFTSFFTYTCNEDSFGFIYTDDDGDYNFTNGIRLPCYTRGLQLPSEEKSYTKSDGSKVKLYERIEEEYELTIDFMPKEWHIDLKVLLAHDTITIQCRNETASGNWGIICKEKYEINWPDMPYQLAPAKTKIIRAQALSLINSNCK